MSNFYGKRFLSALMGALSVLSSPVASAKDDKLGKGNLKDEVESSAGRGKNNGKLGKLKSNRAGNNGSGRGDLGKGVPSASRDKNNGKLGELESDRKVKSIGDLKKVLKETGGKVVGVSPDGKGGFVAFIKTPRGIVTVTIVGVPLLVVLGLVARYVFSGRANVFEKASGALLAGLFFNKKKKYGSFVKKLFEDFFDDQCGVLRGKFGECNGNLDGFLEAVFKQSMFAGYSWSISNTCSCVSWTADKISIRGFNEKGCGKYVEGIFSYLSGKELVEFSGVEGQAVWRDKIGAILFSFWCLCMLDLGSVDDAANVGVKLDGSGFDIKGIFDAIKEYVRGCLEAANKNYNGEEFVLISY